MDSKYNESRYRKSVLEFLLSENIKRGLSGKDNFALIDNLLEFLLDSSEADYIAITVWDNERQIPYLHRYISAGNLHIPPARPGISPLGVCMSTGEPVYGRFSDFPKTDSTLKKYIGHIICIPIEIPGENLIGAIGIGRSVGKPPFTFWADANVRIASNVASLIVSIMVFRDLIKKEEETFEGMKRLLDAIADEKNNWLEKTVEVLKDLFQADHVLISRFNSKNQIIEPLIYYGFEAPFPIPVGKGLSGTVVAEGKPKFFRSYPTDKIPEGYEKYAYTVNSAMGAPVKVDGKISYVIVLARKREKPHFTASDYYFFRLFQRVLSLAFTLHKRIEERQTFTKMKAISERVESLGVMASGIAHDFNNVINVIMGYAQIGLEAATDEESKKIMEAIYNQCLKVAELTSHILSLGKEEMSTEETIDLKGLIEGMCSLLKRTVPENIKLQLETDGHTNYSVKGDPSQLKTALLNLVSNAVDAMPLGGTLTLRLKKQDKTTGIKSEKTVILEVEDTGEGIPEEIVDRIFDPFFTTKSIGKGTGLGLAQVSRVITSMGGFIDVESKPPKGTKFTIYLPEASIAEKPLLKPRGRILLIDQDKELIDTIDKMLKNIGIEAHIETNTEQISGEILKDLSCIITGDPDLLKTVKEKKPELGVVLIADYTDDLPLLRRCILSHSKAELLLKPFIPIELFTVLKRICSLSD